MGDDLRPVDGLAGRLGVATEALAQELAGPFARCLRQHPRRGALGPWPGLTPLPWTTAGFRHDSDADPGAFLDYHTGTAYPQDGASQVPVLLLDPQPGMVVVDCCAAPGSKSTQIGLALGDDGLLLCCDNAAPRRRVLAENLQRQGVACAVVTPLPIERLAAEHPGMADAVLVDAPCSGHEATAKSRAVARNADRQGRLLTAAVALLRPGGRLVYSTCTPWWDENEGVIQALLLRHRDLCVEPIALPGCDADLAGLGGLRLWPTRQGSEPFFAIRLRRAGDGVGHGLTGRQPPVATPAVAVAAPCWRLGPGCTLASPQAAACAVPAELRGLPLHGGDGRLGPWAAQAVLERGAEAVVVDAATALLLWGGAAAELPPGALVRSQRGAPLAQVGNDGRLRLPSRLVRSGLR